MAVKLKLTRLGSKKHPFYRVVAANDETRRDGTSAGISGILQSHDQSGGSEVECGKNQGMARTRGRTHGDRALVDQETYGLAPLRCGLFGFCLRDVCAPAESRPGRLYAGGCRRYRRPGARLTQKAFQPRAG